VRQPIGRAEDFVKIPNATYPSPNLRYDAVAQVVIFERVNPDTGDVTFQTPSRATIRDEARAASTAPKEAATPSRLAPAAVKPGVLAPRGPSAGTGAGLSHISIMV
jgi:hypothetical protein